MKNHRNVSFVKTFLFLHVQAVAVWLISQQSSRWQQQSDASGPPITEVHTLTC